MCTKNSPWNLPGKAWPLWKTRRSYTNCFQCLSKAISKQGAIRQKVSKQHGVTYGDTQNRIESRDRQNIKGQLIFYHVVKVIHGFGEKLQ